MQCRFAVLLAIVYAVRSLSAIDVNPLKLYRLVTRLTASKPLLPDTLRFDFKWMKLLHC